MTDAFGATRTPAVNIWVTFRFDGALLLELLADWYTVLGVAESAVEDVEGTAGILTSWASGEHGDRPSQRFPGPGLRRADFAELRGNYTRGFGVGFIGARHRDRSAMGGFYRDEELFVEMFGSQGPTDQGRLEAFTARLAREMRVFFRRSRAKAQQRLAGGAYLAVLTGHLEELRAMRSDQGAYRGLEHTLAAIVEDERYLRIAEDGRARELIADIERELSFLYGRLMDLDRGGIVH